MFKVEAGKDKAVFDAIKKLAGIKKARATYGIYDLIIEVEFDTIEELDAYIFDQLREISGVNETVTVITSRTVV